MIAAALAAAAALLPAGTPVAVETAEPLSSRTSAKGDMVALRLCADLVADGVAVARAGAPAAGQIAESRGSGGMGTSGKLVVRPLFLRVGDRVVRLSGGASRSGATGADTVAGLLLVGALISGRSARLPAGTRVPAVVERAVAVEPPAP